MPARVRALESRACGAAARGMPASTRTHEDPFMNPMTPCAPAARHWLPLLAMAAAVVLVGGCGVKRDRVPSQAAAKVNGDEITLPQLNFVLQQQRGLRPEQAESAAHQILERLVDQQLAVQKADEEKLERLPGVVQALDAARREVLARAYLEKTAERAAKPTPEEVHKYYEDKPALFADRRVYNIQEILVEARPEQVPVLRDKLAASKAIGEFIDYLKAGEFRFAGNQAVRAAEQLPWASLEAFARMKDGQAMVVPAPNGVQVVVLAGSRSQPVTEEQARPAIEQYILNERKRKLVEDDVKALRAAAKIQYVGKFAQPAASSASSAGPASKG
jgi:EpsD family peptidyl-prolyl cis-trans isomerase